MHQLLRAEKFGVALSVSLVLAGCGGSDIVLPGDAIPGGIIKSLGDGQTGQVGAALAEPIVVQVVDQRGNPLPGVRVAFAPAENSPGAEARPDAVTTGSDGKAQTEWVLGSSSGPQSLLASVADIDGLEVAFEASARAAEAQRIEEAGGNNQNATVGGVLPDPLVVLVTDQFGNPVEGTQIEWSAEGGSVDPGSSTTGPDGKASTSWTLGSAIGSQSATATVEGLEGSPVSFTATAAAGRATRLVLVSGNNQSGSPNQELAQPLVVRLEDADGNGVSGRAVSWVIGSGGGEVSANTSTTDPNGEAQVRWKLGPTAGLNTLNAVVSGVGFVTFRATAGSTSGGGGGNGGGDDNGGGGNGGGGEGGGNDGGGGNPQPSPTRMVFLVQPSDAEKGKTLEPPVQVAILDQNGARVTQGEFQVKLELLGDNGKLKGHDRETARSGVATFADLKVDKEGQYRLRAAAEGLPAVDSDAFEIHEHGGHGKD
jgi:Bacterial Ig-like domain (group 1)